MTNFSTSEAVAKLWDRFRPVVEARITTIEAFVAGDEGIRADDAARAAHNLVGALGSYGRHEGSQLARQIEQAVRSADPAQRAQLPKELAALRAAVE